MLDIEKIEYEITSDKTSDQNRSLFIEKTNRTDVQEIGEFKKNYKETCSLIWEASLYNSSCLLEIHLKLQTAIWNLYRSACSILSYDFGLTYLTDKLAVCCQLYNFLKERKAA